MLARSFLAAALLSAASSAAGAAGDDVQPRRLPDSPPVSSQAGSALKVIYRFSGVRDDGYQGTAGRKLATALHCSNPSGKAVTMRVRLLGYYGNVYSDQTYTVQPAWTLSILTQAITSLSGVQLNTGSIAEGQGVVMASSNALVCSAMFMDAINNPPNFATGLHMERYNPKF